MTAGRWVEIGERVLCMQMYRTVSESGITRISTAVDGTSVDTHPVHAHMHSRSGDEGPALEPQPRADCGQHTCVHNPQMNINAQEVELKVTSQVVGLWEGPAGNISRPGVEQIHPSSLGNCCKQFGGAIRL